MRLVVTARLDDGREHELAIDGVGYEWEKAFDQKRREEPDGWRHDRDRIQVRAVW